jgi:APA family basic amino acid/polyamine antiporter
LSQGLIGAAIAVIAAVFPIDVLGEMVSIGTLAAFALVCVAVMYLRHSHPETPRPFRVPGSPALPALGVLACLGLMAGLPWETWARLLLWLLLGVGFYFVYGHRNAAKIRR